MEVFLPDLSSKVIQVEVSLSRMEASLMEGNLTQLLNLTEALLTPSLNPTQAIHSSKDSSRGDQDPTKEEALHSSSSTRSLDSRSPGHRLKGRNKYLMTISLVDVL